MAHVYLKAGETLTLSTGAVMTTGPYGSVIDSQIRWESAGDDFVFPVNPQRNGVPYGFIEVPFPGVEGHAVQLFDVYLDQATNALWYDDRHAFTPGVSVEPDTARSPGTSWLKAAIDGLPDKALAWLMWGRGPFLQKTEMKTLNETKKLAEESSQKLIVADRLEMVLVDKLWRADALLLNTVLAMLSTRVQSGDSSLSQETFAAQMSALDQHVSALSLYDFGRDQIIDLPYSRESIESLMKLPKLIDQIFLDSGYSKTIYIPLPTPDYQMMEGFRSFAERTGLTLEAVIA